MSDRYVETVVIGGSQSGLAIGHHLSRRGLPSAIPDGNDRIGDAWPNRYDCMRLFAPRHYSRLPGLPFPGPPPPYPTKDETADYLEAYVRMLELPAETGVHVDRLSKVGDRFEMACAASTLSSKNVVVATGAYQTPRFPSTGYPL